MSLKYNRIISAIDGSDASEKAFNKAIEIAKANDATLILTHIVDIQVYPVSIAYDRTLEEHAKENANELLANYEEKAQNAGVTKIEKVIEYGSPRVLIGKTVAPRTDADLIVIGAVGHGMIERFVIGSVSESAVRHSNCDVLVVK